MNAETDIAVLRAVIEEMDRRYVAMSAAQERATKVALEAQEKAILKAEAAAEKRFDSVNEFRKTLTDQAGTFATREAVNGQVESLKADIKRIENQNAAVAGRGLGMSQLWGLLMGAAALLTAVFIALRG